MISSRGNNRGIIVICVINFVMIIVFSKIFIIVFLYFVDGINWIIVRVNKWVFLEFVWGYKLFKCFYFIKF